jgi:Flp pilus assembly protein TadG
MQPIREAEHRRGLIGDQWGAGVARTFQKVTLLAGRMAACAVRGRRGVLGRLSSDRRGMSALELALTAPILTGAVIAVVDLGNAAQQQILLQQALEAGAQYAIVDWQNNQPSDGTLESDAKSAVTNALPSNWTASQVSISTPALSCMCWNSGNSSRSACGGTGNKGGTCTGSGQTPTPELYVSLTASATYSGLFITPTVTANYEARYQ